MTRSPGGPPGRLGCPCPRSMTLEPVSVPGGTVIEILRSVRTSPAPRHVGHFSDGIFPRPRHWGQGRLTAKLPCPNEIVPRPWHSGQVENVAPGAPPLPVHVGQVSVTGKVTGIFPPSIATRNGTSTTASRVSPSGSSPAGRRPRPNIEEKMSPSPAIERAIAAHLIVLLALVGVG